MSINTGAFNFWKMPHIDWCKEGRSKPAPIFVGDQSSQRIQQDLVQEAEEEKQGELDSVALQLVHCSCHDHTWGQRQDPHTGCPFWFKLTQILSSFCFKTKDLSNNCMIPDKRSTFSSIHNWNRNGIQVSSLRKFQIGWILLYLQHCLNIVGASCLDFNQMTSLSLKLPTKYL